MGNRFMIGQSLLHDAVDGYLNELLLNNGMDGCNPYIINEMIEAFAICKIEQSPSLKNVITLFAIILNYQPWKDLIDCQTLSDHWKSEYGPFFTDVDLNYLINLSVEQRELLFPLLVKTMTERLKTFHNKNG